jgi:hypothetical protein
MSFLASLKYESEVDLTTTPQALASVFIYEFSV